ncbi:hypothetical protein T459_30306 [Capsicum annuum]|uniref:Uncharacterized protein n=1 Tax=Capsicum annuum TaxID=4072 RepID=A0A2G2Y8J9_CAPAN|nr:hypothetical protein T459_30306 [Capsicum annuum]
MILPSHLVEGHFDIFQIPVAHRDFPASRIFIMTPFKLFTVFLHEVSHAIACKLTCGEVMGSKGEIFIILEFVTGGELFDKIVRYFLPKRCEEATEEGKRAAVDCGKEARRRQHVVKKLQRRIYAIKCTTAAK